MHRSAFVAPTAVLIGDVEIGPEASVFYGCVLRGDVGSIRVGARTNIQDNTVIHCESAHPTVLEEDVTIGHMALIHGAHVEAGTLIGMKAALLSGSRVGAGALVAAGSVVLEGQQIPAKALAAGLPAKVKRQLSDEESAAFLPHAAHYVETARDQQWSEVHTVSLSDAYFD